MSYSVIWLYSILEWFQLVKMDFLCLHCYIVDILSVIKKNTKAIAE